MAMGPMGGRGLRPAEKSKRGLRGVQRELFSYSERIRLPMLIALVLAAAGAVLTILGPNQLSKITNLISDSLMGEIDLAAIGRVAGVLLGIYALSALLTYIEHYIMATVTLGLSKQMRRDLCAKINRVPMSCFNRIAHGDILSRVTNDVSTLQQALSNSLPSMISAVAQLTGCVIMMFVTEWRMALAAIAATMIGFVFMFIIMKRSQKYFVDRQESLGTLNGYIEEMYSGHDVVRISRANDRIKETFRGMNRAVYEANRKSQFLSGIMQPLMNVIGNLGYVAVCVLGAALVMNGSIKFGVITAFILYVRLFTSPLTTIAQGMTQLQSAAAAGDRVFDFLQEPELPDESKNLPVPQPARGEIERAVEGEDDGGTLRDLQILRRDADAVRTEIVDLAAQVFQIDDDAVAEHIHNALGENAGRDEMQGKLAVLIDDGMAGVVAALIANDNIIILCDEVDHAALAFIAPVDADDCTIAHNTSAPVSAQWA